MTILIAEDHPTNQTLIRELCRAAGRECQIVDNGAEAVAAIASAAAFSLVLMDIHMPVMDGIEATRALRSQGCALPIVAVTADTSPATSSACSDAGVTEIFPKPIDLRAFLALLSRFP